MRFLFVACVGFSARRVVNLGLTGVVIAAVSLRAAPVDVRVNPEVRHQTIEGFGASIMGWVESVRPLYYDDAFVDYVANTLGQSIFRLQMWGGVSPTEISDWRDISYKDFVWEGEGLRGRVNIDFARKLSVANPEVRIIGSVWSGPAWMKQNNSRVGTRSGYELDPQRDYDHDNRLREDRYRHFAKWVVEWARAMEAQGTPFYAISLQNELLFTQWYESTLYSPEEYARVVKVTGEMFESEGVRKPLFYGPEDMSMATYEDPVRHRPYVDALMAPDVARYFDVFATHGYSDGVRGDGRQTPVGYARAIERFGRPYWITEGGTGPHEWPLALTEGVAVGLHVALTRADVSLVCGWQVTGSVGQSTEHNFMDGDTPTPKTYAAMHYWRHIRPGAVRVEATESPAEGLHVSAFVHDRRGEQVVVLLNTGNVDRQVRIDGMGEAGAEWRAYQTTEDRQHAEVDNLEIDDGGRAMMTLPALSLTTVVARTERGKAK